MNTYIEKIIHRLRKYYGSHSAAARELGLTPRSFRKNRNGKMPTRIESIIRHVWREIQLRLILRELVVSGVVSPAALKQAWRKVRER